MHAFTHAFFAVSLARIHLSTAPKSHQTSIAPKLKTGTLQQIQATVLSQHRYIKLLFTWASCIREHRPQADSSCEPWQQLRPGHTSVAHEAEEEGVQLKLAQMRRTVEEPALCAQTRALFRVCSLPRPRQF